MFNIVVEAVYNNRVEFDIIIVKEYPINKGFITQFREYTKFNFDWFIGGYYDVRNISIINPNLIINKDNDISEYIEIINQNMFLTHLYKINKTIDNYVDPNININGIINQSIIENNDNIKDNNDYTDDDNNSANYNKDNENENENNELNNNVNIENINNISNFEGNNNIAILI